MDNILIFPVWHCLQTNHRFFKTLIDGITRVNLSCCCCCHTLKQKEMPLMQIWAGQLLLTSEEFLTTWLVLFVSHEFGPFLRPLESSWCSIKKFWNKKIRTEIKLKKQTKKTYERPFHVEFLTKFVEALYLPSSDLIFAELPQLFLCKEK